MSKMACSERIGWVAFLLAFTWSGLHAQPGSVDLACSATQVDSRIPTEPYWALRHPSVLAESLAVLENDGRWEMAMQRIQALYRQDVQFFPDGAQLSVTYNHVRDTLDAFSARLAGAVGETDSKGVDGAIQFRVQEHPDEGGYTILAQRESVPANADPVQARSICYLGHTMIRFHERLTKVARQATELVLRRRVSRWNAFMDRGLTPLPWELALNESLNWFHLRQSLEPPRLQLIAFRPSAAIETDSRLEQRVSILLVEAVGFAYYPESRSWWFSASGIWGSPSESTAGWGVLFRLAPWLISAGVNWRDIDGDGNRERRVLLSIDAYDLIRDAPKRLREAASRATGGRIVP